MPKFIDIEKIKPIDFPSTEMDGLDVVRYLNTLPTVDAVEVIRCKDCKHWCYGYDCVGLCTVDVPDIDGVQREDFDFCSYGERKDNG